MVNKYIVSDAIADFLIEKNIEIAFAIIGSFNVYILDSINKFEYSDLMFEKLLAIQSILLFFIWKIS